MLPRTDKSIYSTVIPSTQQKVRYTPFSVKDEKLTLIANESQDLNEILMAMKQVIRNCVVEELDVDSLAIFDVQYLYLQLKSKSVGSVIPCIITVDKQEYNVDIDINKDITIEYPENFSNKIVLDTTKNIGIQLKYPGLDVIQELQNLDNKNEVDKIFSIIFNCTDMIFDTNSVYLKRDIEEKEFFEWLEHLTMEQLDQIIAFFDKQPKLQIKVEYKDKEGKLQEFKTSDLRSFL